MTRKTMLALVALLGVVILGGGGSYWAYKKIRAKMQAKQNQEYRCEAKMVLWDGFDAKAFKATVVSDEILDPIIERYDLVNFWELSDVAGARVQIRKKLGIEVMDSHILVSYQDHDGQVAQHVLEGILKAYQEKMNAGQRSLPAS